MKELEKRIAIEAVARHFAATWETGKGAPDAWLTVAGKRVAVDVAVVKHRAAGRGGVPKPRLRFDRVALRFVAGLQDALREALPEGKALILTVTAPIRLPARAAAALGDAILGRPAQRSQRVDFADTIHGNQIRACLVTSGIKGPSSTIGFVHNPDSDAVVLLDMAQSLLERIGAAAGRRLAAGFTGERWLVIADSDGLPLVEAYRHACSQLAAPAGFDRILLATDRGRVETLKG